MSLNHFMKRQAKRGQGKRGDRGGSGGDGSFMDTSRQGLGFRSTTKREGGQKKPNLCDTINFNE